MSNNNLAINSLKIENFKCFEHLEIEKFGNINLIVGKNSVGKTSLLEAIYWFCDTSHLYNFIEILKWRKEIQPYRDIYDILSSMIYGRPDVSSLPSNLELSVSSNNAIQQMNFGWVEKNEKKEFITNQNDLTQSPMKNGVKISFNFENPVNQKISKPSNILSYTELYELISNYKNNPTNYAHFIKQNHNIKFINSKADNINVKLWNNIDLTSLKEHVIKFLQIIEPTIIDFAVDITDTSIYKVRFKNLDKPVFVSSLGEGINRLLCVMMHLVNCKDGVLIIDEIENGLHYSIQVESWQMIFKIAQELNVQVFATTHSDDCVKAFGQVAIENDDQDGVLIRLDNKQGKIIPVFFGEKKLEFATQEQIEVR